MFLSVGEGLIDPPERCQFAQKMTSQYESNGTNVREEGGARKEIGRASCRERVCQYV